MIVCPANLTVSNDAGKCGAHVAHAIPTASDNCPGATVACNPPSGSFFAKGATTVTCTATDAAGNTAKCTDRKSVGEGERAKLACPGVVGVKHEPGLRGHQDTTSGPMASNE